jgi:hypothetical protein
MEVGLAKTSHLVYNDSLRDSRLIVVDSTIANSISTIIGHEVAPQLNTGFSSGKYCYFMGYLLRSLMTMYDI